MDNKDKEKENFYYGSRSYVNLALLWEIYTVIDETLIVKKEWHLSDVNKNDIHRYIHRCIVQKWKVYASHQWTKRKIGREEAERGEKTLKCFLPLSSVGDGISETI